MALACVPLAACGDDDANSEVSAAEPPAANAQPFRVYDRGLWGSPVIVGSKAVLVGKLVEGGTEFQVQTVDPAVDTTEAVLDGILLDRLSTTAKDDSIAIIEFRECEAIGPSGESSDETTCTEHKDFRLIEYNLDDRTASDVSVPADLQRLLDAANGVDLNAYADGTLFLTLQDEAVLTEVRWDMESDTFLSSPIDTNSSTDVGSTCVTDDGIRYDTVVTNGSFATFIDELEEGPTGERTVNELPEPPPAMSRWETTCVGASAFVAAVPHPDSAMG